MRFLTGYFPFMLFVSFPAFGQDSLGFFDRSAEFNKSRFVTVAAVQTAGYGGSLALLSSAWYKDYPRTPFHSFDDSPEWLQMDKAGHVITSWYLGRMGSSMYEWSGVPKRKAAWYGALSGWAYLTAIEILDGFSDGWGFSWSDFGANTLGTGIILMQEFSKAIPIMEEKTDMRARNIVRGLSLKFSFHQTIYPAFRPKLLGKNFGEQLVKDYNGQTYWLSFNLSSFMKQKTKFPGWLSAAAGYGGENMISGRPGYVHTYPGGEQVEFVRYRQYYLSLDIDITRIKTKSYFLKALAETFCFIKIPAPAIEFSRKGIKGHVLYF